MTELRTCSNCWYRQTCNLDGLTAKSCGVWMPWRPMDYALRWSKSIRRESHSILELSNSLIRDLAELRAQRDAEQHRGVDAKP